MGNLTAHEMPTHPRPLFLCLPSAVRAAIAYGSHLSEINTCLWATTYHCTPEQVEAEWTRALSNVPPNSTDDDIGEGK